jgi:hypothetical protein
MVVTAHVDVGGASGCFAQMASVGTTVAGAAVAVAVVPRLTRVLRLLVDTSTWLDLAKRRDGQKWIVAIRLNVQWGNLQLLVSSLVIDEFQRNRPRVEASMTSSVADRLKQMRRDFDEYGGETYQEAIEVIDKLAHQVPLIGAMTTRNFDEILALLRAGKNIEPTDGERSRVVQRGLDNKAPFHRSTNSVADALRIEMYASAIASADLEANPHGFVTSNFLDFSLVNGDRRRPHEDLAEYFALDGSSYWRGVEGLNSALLSAFGDKYQELLDESDFREEPRRLDEIVDAESELFDRIWYNRSLSHEYRLEDAGDDAEVQRLLGIAGPGRRRVEERFGGSDNLGPYDDLEWGMLNGKLSALRWVLGSEWDFLDT